MLGEDLSYRLDDGETVYRPNPESDKKRKRKTGPLSSRKKYSSVADSSDTEPGDDSDASDKENSQPDLDRKDEKRPPLTDGEIDAELAEIKAQKKALRKSKKIIDNKISKVEKEVTTLHTEEKALLSEVKSCCIKGRNEYSRGAIKNDFSMGIRE